jgi:post-segregation antitoxin (ccd killing protein)
MAEENTLLDLTNPPFTFKIGDKELQVKKASIVQIEQFYIRKDALMKNPELTDEVRSLKMVSYALFLIANAADKSITESWIEENANSVSNPISILAKLGFIDPLQAEMVSKIQSKLITENNSVQ